MKVVADSMIWYSYFVDPDSFRCRLLEEALKQGVRFFVSEYLIEEVVKAATMRLKEGRRYGVRIRHRFRKHAQLVTLPQQIPRHVPGDKGDDPIVETAKRAHANYLISADNELLKLKRVGTVKITTAAEFARLLTWSPE